MITVFTQADYAFDPELKKTHREWLNNIHTQRVLATLDVSSRSHLVRTQGLATDDKLIAFGKNQGMQLVIDTIRSLDATQMQSGQIEEDFTEPPAR